MHLGRQKRCLKPPSLLRPLVSSPILTVSWTAPGSQQWTVPLGGGVRKIVHLGPLPVNMQLSGYYNVARPTEGPSWQIRTQVQFLFPR